MCDNKNVKDLHSEKQGKTNSLHWRCGFNEKELQGGGRIALVIHLIYIIWANVKSDFLYSTFHIVWIKSYPFSSTFVITTDHIKDMTELSSTRAAYLA